MKFTNFRVSTTRELTHIRKVTLISEDRAPAAPCLPRPARQTQLSRLLASRCQRLLRKGPRAWPGASLKAGKCLPQKLQVNGQTAMPFTLSVSLSIALKHRQIIPGDAGLRDGLTLQGRVSIWTQLTLNTFCEGPSCAFTVGCSAPSLAPTL